MLKISILVATLTIVSFAKTPQDINLSNVTNLKEFTQALIDDAEVNQTAKLLIKNREKRTDGESFVSTVIKQKDNISQTNKDKNATNDSNITQVAKSTITDADMAFDELAGLSFANDMNYSQDVIDTKSTLVGIPDRDQMDENDSKDIHKIINEKLIVIRSHYSLKNHLFSVTLKDINSTLSKLNIVSKGLKVDGYFDPKETLKNRSHLAVDKMNFVFTTPQTIGNYLTIDHLEATSETTSDEKTLNMNYKMNLDLFDANLSDEHSKIEKLKLNITVGNIDIKAYKELEEFGRKHPNPTDADMDRLQALSIKLLTSNNIYIELTDLSIGNIVDHDKVLGSSKATAKISLTDNKNLAQMIALNPMMALSALKVNAKIVLSSKMMQRAVKHKKAALIMLLPSKKEDNNFIYEIKYEQSKLTINGQKF